MRCSIKQAFRAPPYKGVDVPRAKKSQIGMRPLGPDDIGAVMSAAKLATGQGPIFDDWLLMVTTELKREWECSPMI